MIVLCMTMLAHAAPGTYGIGRPPSAAELRAADISIAPDGAGLPPGRGSSREGASLYQSLCASCHGVRGEGRGDFPALVGGRGSLATPNPVLTVGSYWPYATTLWDYINRAMPFDRPGLLTADEVYGAAAYVLFLNGIVGETDRMDAKSLPKVKMPNRDGFVRDPRPDVGSIK